MSDDYQGPDREDARRSVLDTPRLDQAQIDQVLRGLVGGESNAVFSGDRARRYQLWRPIVGAAPNPAIYDTVLGIDAGALSVARDAAIEGRWAAAWDLYMLATARSPVVKRRALELLEIATDIALEHHGRADVSDILVQLFLRPLRVAFCMINPSTAGGAADDNDPTIRRCMGYAYRWGFGTLGVVNLFASVSTDPKALVNIAQLWSAMGRDQGTRDFTQDRSIQLIMESCDLIVCAWGASVELSPAVTEAACEAINLVREQAIRTGHDLWCLGCTKKGKGHPRHPLRLSYETPLEKFAALDRATRAAVAREEAAAAGYGPWES